MPPSPSVSPVEVYAGADLRLPLAAALQDILRGKLGLRGLGLDTHDARVRRVRGGGEG